MLAPSRQFAPIETRALAERLRATLDYAEQGGAPAAFLAWAAMDLLAALVELQALRRGERDPRRARTLERAHHVARAQASGATVDQLQQRFGYGRQHIHRLLRLHAAHVARHQATVSGFHGSAITAEY